MTPYFLSKSKTFQKIFHKYRKLHDYIDFTQCNLNCVNTIDVLIVQGHDKIVQEHISKDAHANNMEEYMELRKKQLTKNFQNNEVLQFDHFVYQFKNAWEIMVDTNNQTVGFKDADSGNSVLHQFVLHNQFENAKVLIDQHNADVNSLNDHNENLAHLIFQRINCGVENALEYLISKKINLN